MRTLILFFLLAGSGLLFPALAPIGADGEATLYLSTNQRDSWEPLVDGLPDKAVPQRVFDLGSDLFLALSDGTLYRLPATETRWQNSNAGLPADVAPSSLVVFGKQHFLGTYGHGIFRSRDGGRSWQPVLLGGPNPSVHTLFVTDNGVLAGTNRGIYRTVDGGFSWARTGETLPINDIAVAEGTLYAATTAGIALSKDGGQTWTPGYRGGNVYRLQTSGPNVYGHLDDNRYAQSAHGHCWQEVAAYPLCQDYPFESELTAAERSRLPKAVAESRVMGTSRGWLAGFAPGC